tara:strand:- start:2264 stop:2593 length:330 start_codon:yes stop_codon:yes gene_type:complete
MAFTPYHNITGSTGVTTELIKPGSNSGALNSIVITNTRAGNGATVTLFLQSNPANAAPKTFNILSTVAIPESFSLLLDNEDMISFDNSTYGMYITVGSSDTLDVLINKE